MEKKTSKKLLLLTGEGANSHVLEAEEIQHDDVKTEELSEIHVGDNGKLTHVDPAGNPAEHHTIPIKKGKWLVGHQVEWNAFDNSISGVFD